MRMLMFGLLLCIRGHPNKIRTSIMFHRYKKIAKAIISSDYMDIQEVQEMCN